MKNALLTRFWSKADKSGDCWLWTASNRNKWGYGQFWHKGRMQSAHRAAHEIEIGEIPDGMCVLHTCDQPLCVRPDHLFLGTVADNNSDKAEKGRSYNGYRKGESNGNNKLCELDIWLIRRLDGTHQQIAGWFDVSRTLITRIKNRDVWTHVE